MGRTLFFRFIAKGQAKEMNLHPRQSQILRLMSEGKTTKEIAQELHLSVNTIKTYKRLMYQDNNVHNAAEMVAKWMDERDF